MSQRFQLSLGGALQFQIACLSESLFELLIDCLDLHTTLPFAVACQCRCTVLHGQTTLRLPDTRICIRSSACSSFQHLRHAHYYPAKTCCCLDSLQTWKHRYSIGEFRSEST